MKREHLLALLLAVIPLACFSQTELNDSISFMQNKFEGVNMEGVIKPDSLSSVKITESYYYEYAPALRPLFPYTLAQPLDLQIPDFNFTRGHASLFNWNSGAIVASGGTRSFPGLMQIDSGTLGICQSVGNFTFHAGGIVNKYVYFMAHSTALTEVSHINSRQGYLQLSSENIILDSLREWQMVCRCHRP